MSNRYEIAGIVPSHVKLLNHNYDEYVLPLEHIPQKMLLNLRKIYEDKSALFIHENEYGGFPLRCFQYVVKDSKQVRKQTFSLNATSILIEYGESKYQELFFIDMPTARKYYLLLTHQNEKI